MSTTSEYIEFVCEQVKDAGSMHYKKMFGEYMVYFNNKPVLLVCDNTVFVKQLPCVEELMSGSETAIPYKSAKEHYILDIENIELCLQVLEQLVIVTLVPKPRKKAISKIK